MAISVYVITDEVNHNEVMYRAIMNFRRATIILRKSVASHGRVTEVRETRVHIV